MVNPSFWQGKRVLLTGHTGFKGAWAALWLSHLGAKVTGLSLPPSSELFALLEPDSLNHKFIDLRDRAAVSGALKHQRFDIVIHAAAQALVRQSFHAPVDTYASNVMGTAHLLEALQASHPQVILVVTSDKVYKNQNTNQPFVETDPLGGDDPYSASKACCELLVQSWRASGLCQSQLITARAGNVLGGGDWAADRLIPDLIRAWLGNTTLSLRYPQATRPWQHVLDVLNGYFTYVQAVAQQQTTATSLNFGPALEACLPAQTIINKMQTALDSKVIVQIDSKQHLPEKSRLTLNTEQVKQQLGWQTRLNIEQSLQWTAQWYRAWQQGADMREFSLQQIANYQGLKS